MRKKLYAVAMSLCMLSTLMGCAANSTSGPTASSAENMTAFTDDLGHEFKIVQPQRVAVTMGSFADIWCLAGGKDQLVAACSDAFTDFDLDLSEDVADLGEIKAPNMETLIASQPDLVLASSNLSPDLKMEQTLNDAGITVAYFDASTFDSYLNVLKVCTDLTGMHENYDSYGTDVAQQVNDAKEKISGASPSILYVRVNGSTCTVKNSKGTVLGEMLADRSSRST